MVRNIGDICRGIENIRTGISVEEVTKLEKNSLSDFTLCKTELLHTEESHQRFFQTCTDSLLVCASDGGMFTCTDSLFLPPLTVCLEARKCFTGEVLPPWECLKILVRMCNKIYKDYGSIVLALFRNMF